jgi:hypothetical protein
MLMFMLQWLDIWVWVSEVQLTSSSSSARGRLGDNGTVRKLVVATTAGADDAMPARREKAIFGLNRKGKKQRALHDVIVIDHRSTLIHSTGLYLILIFFDILANATEYL